MYRCDGGFCSRKNTSDTKGNNVFAVTPLVYFAACYSQLSLIGMYRDVPPISMSASGSFDGKPQIGMRLVIGDASGYNAITSAID